jgi:hypothetical protein
MVQVFSTLIWIDDWMETSMCVICTLLIKCEQTEEVEYDNFDIANTIETWNPNDFYIDNAWRIGFKVSCRIRELDELPIEVWIEKMLERKYIWFTHKRKSKFCN